MRWLFGASRCSGDGQFLLTFSMPREFIWGAFTGLQSGFCTFGCLEVTIVNAKHQSALSP